jgi:hypothetical protein
MRVNYVLRTGRPVASNCRFEKEFRYPGQLHLQEQPNRGSDPVLPLATVAHCERSQPRSIAQNWHRLHNWHGLGCRGGSRGQSTGRRGPLARSRINKHCLMPGSMCACIMVCLINKCQQFSKGYAPSPGKCLASRQNGQIWTRNGQKKSSSATPTLAAWLESSL